MVGNLTVGRSPSRLIRMADVAVGELRGAAVWLMSVKGAGGFGRLGENG